MSRFSNVVALIAMVLFAANSQAGSYQGKISEIMMGDAFGNAIYIKTAEDFSKPSGSCSTHSEFAFAIDGSTARGKSVLSLLTAALVAEKTVYLQGPDNCNFPSVENLTVFRLKAN